DYRDGRRGPIWESTRNPRLCSRGQSASERVPTLSHALYIEDDKGDLIDSINLCTDTCSRTYAKRIEVEYRGWNGCHEQEFTTWCANCGVVLPGFAGDNQGELCSEQDANIVVARFRSDSGEKCERHNGKHWIQLPAHYLTI
ncbi:hypothetical protein LCGC14_1813100, partial [marine sediment metagenome]